MSFLEDKGVPSIVERTLIRPPSSQLGPLTLAERKAAMAASPLAGVYDTAVDRESAAEVLQGRAAKAAEEVEAAEASPNFDLAIREFNSGTPYSGGSSSKKKTTTKKSRSDGVGKTFAKSLARQIGSQAGRQLVRGVLGSLFKGR